MYYLTLVISVVYSRRRTFSGAIESLQHKVDAGSHVLTPGPVSFPIVSCKIVLNDMLIFLEIL